MNKIRENIYLSGWPAAANLQVLNENGITAILNVAHDINNPDLCPAETISDVKVGLGDFNGNKPYMKDLAIHTLKTMLANGEKVLVHCAAGASRSVWVVCRTIADLEGKDIKDVYEEVRLLRPEASFGPLF